MTCEDRKQKHETTAGALLLDIYGLSKLFSPISKLTFFCCDFLLTPSDLFIVYKKLEIYKIYTLTVVPIDYQRMKTTCLVV
jgi:hypothetical protein